MGSTIHFQSIKVMLLKVAYPIKADSPKELSTSFTHIIRHVKQRWEVKAYYLPRLLTHRSMVMATVE